MPAVPPDGGRAGLIFCGIVTSVPGKMLGLLDLYSHRQSAYTLSELSRLSGLPLSTAHRLVGELERWGALERGSDGRYRIGLRLVDRAKN